MKRFIIMSKKSESIIDRVKSQQEMCIINVLAPDLIVVEMEDQIALKFADDNQDLIVEEDSIIHMAETK